jgi:hypothetical protein
LVPPRIKATTLESQLIHLIQELSGRTLRLVMGGADWGKCRVRSYSQKERATYPQQMTVESVHGRDPQGAAFAMIGSQK